MNKRIIDDLKALRMDSKSMTDKEAIEAAELLGDLRDSTLERFKTGIITALPVEMAALESCFDEMVGVTMRGVRYKIGSAAIRGSNRRRCQAILKQATATGNNLAAVAASDLVRSFPGVDHLMMVGIAGGIPSPERPDKHVRLGDIVVSDQQGVTQYDFGKQYADGFEEVARGRPPSAHLIDSLNELETQELKGVKPWMDHIASLELNLEWGRPANETDLLYEADGSQTVIAHPYDPSRRQGEPRVFRGKIGSANVVLKSSDHRRVLREKHNLVAVEMEGSGVADAAWAHNIGYLVVRGICDYADKRKNDDWHRYAALVAAAYCKALLEV